MFIYPHLPLDTKFALSEHKVISSCSYCWRFVVITQIFGRGDLPPQEKKSKTEYETLQTETKYNIKLMLKIQLTQGFLQWIRRQITDLHLHRHS